MAYDQRKADAYNAAIAEGFDEDAAIDIAGITNQDAYDYAINQDGTMGKLSVGFGGGNPFQEQGSGTADLGLNTEVPTVITQEQADAINENVPGIDSAQPGDVWDPNEKSVTTSWGSAGAGTVSSDNDPTVAEEQLFGGQIPQSELARDDSVFTDQDPFDESDPANIITRTETITETGGEPVVTGGGTTVYKRGETELTAAGLELENKANALDTARTARIKELRAGGASFRDAFNDPTVKELRAARNEVKLALITNQGGLYVREITPSSVTKFDRNGNVVESTTLPTNASSEQIATDTESIVEGTDENINLDNPSTFASEPVPPGEEDPDSAPDLEGTETIDQETGVASIDDTVTVPLAEPDALDIDAAADDFANETPAFGTSAPEVAPSEAVQLRSDGTGTKNFNVDKSLPFAVDDKGRAVYGTPEQLLDAGYSNESINLNGNPAPGGTSSTEQVLGNSGANANNQETPLGTVENPIVQQREDGKYQVVDQDGNAVPGAGVFDTKEEADAFAESVSSTGGFSSATAVQANADVADIATEQAKQRQSIREQLGLDANGANRGDWRVRLSLAPGSSYLYNAENPGILAPLQATGGVIFPYTPQINTNYTANYNRYDLTHSNYKGYFYQNSYVDEIQITADFTAQDTVEAQYMLAVIHFFRSATKMFYGGGNGEPDKHIGAPPPMTYLTGLGDFQFSGHPCLVSNFMYNLPNDVDYIRAGTPNINPASTNTGDRKPKQDTPNPLAEVAGALLGGSRKRLSTSGLGPVSAFTPGDLTQGTDESNPTYVPTKMQIQLTLLPINSRQRISQEFSLRDFATGSLLKGGMW